MPFENQGTLEEKYKGKCSQFWDIFNKPTKPIHYQMTSGKCLKPTEKLKKNFSIFRPKAKSTENKNYTMKLALPPLFKPKSIFQHWEVESEDEQSVYPGYIDIN